MTKTNLTKFSYSKLDTYNQCGFKYKLTYVDHHYDTGTSIALEFGIHIHATEEAIAHAIVENRPIDYDTLIKKTLDKIDVLEQKYPEAAFALDKSGRTYRDKVNFYINYGIYRLENFLKNNPDLKIVGIEKRFQYVFEDKYLFGGAIDRVLFNQKTGELLVQDIKTYNLPVEHSKLVTPLQFVIYTKAAEELYNIPSDKIICQYDLPLCDSVQFAGTKDYMERGIMKMEKLLNNIENKEFVPTPTSLCHWCPFCPTNSAQNESCKNLCPYHSLWTEEFPDFEVATPWFGEQSHKSLLENYIAQKNRAEKLQK